MKIEPWVLVVVAICLIFGGGAYFLASLDDAAVAAEQEYRAAQAIGDYERACAAAGEAALQWQLMGNESESSRWRMSRELACLDATRY